MRSDGEAVLDTSAMSAADLADSLTASAAGVWEWEASIRLLVEHSVWIERPEFRPYIRGELTRSGTVAHYVAWADVVPELRQGRIAGDAEDLLVLRLSAALHHRLEVPVSHIENVAPRTMKAIMRALATHAGYGEKVDGWCPLD